MPAAPWVIEPTGRPVPVVGRLPHGGRDIPAELAGDLAVAQDFLWCVRCDGEHEGPETSSSNSARGLRRVAAVP